MRSSAPAQRWGASSKGRGERQPAPPSDSAAEQELVERLTRAFEADDVDGIVAALTEDVWLTMPPLPLEYRGPELAAEFLAATGFRPGWTAPAESNQGRRSAAFCFYACDP